MKSVFLSLAFILFFTSSKCQLTTDKLVVHFDFNKSNINEEARMQLDSVLNANRNRFSLTSIQLFAHCDSIGNNRCNDSLSRERAKAVKEFFVAAGINDSVFTKMEAHGKRQPLNQNANEEERFLNRRVELIIQKNLLKTDPTTPQKNLKEVINDSATKVGTTIVLKNLNFEGGRHVLLSRSLPILNQLLEAMQQNPNLKVEIHGHVCCTANYLDGRDNDLGTFDLSWQRAKVVYQYLVKNGISEERMSYKGFGASQKLYPEERDAYEQEENRRVEIKIVSK